MKAKPHGINFTDDDHKTLKYFADKEGVSVSEYVNYIVGKHLGELRGCEWQGLKPRGWNQHSEKDVNSTEPPENGDN